MRLVILCFFLLFAPLAGPARAQDHGNNLAPPQGDFNELLAMDTAVVEQVIDPLRVRLKDGRIVRLSSLDIPELHLPDPGEAAVQAQSFLKEFIEGKSVRLYQTRNAEAGRTNRMGHQMAHLVRAEDSVWVQGALLAKGLARIMPGERHTEMAGQMLALENEARIAKRGLWVDTGRFALLTPETAEQGIGGLAIVEGTVRGVGTVNNRLFLNFGPDWRSDFTVGLEPAVRRGLISGGTDPMNLNGRVIRVHGWLESWNGPYINVLDPVWLEIVK